MTFNGSSDTIFCNNIGVFETGAIPTNLGIGSGVIIATGNVNVAAGPNNNTSHHIANNCNTFNDPNLASIATAPIHDVAVLEFDFVPWDSVIKFNYVFGSEEYLEYVGSEYNDVFGFFVTGPNPDGGNYNNQNMAIIPNTNEVVSINTVHPECINGFGNNPARNSEYYVDNTGGTTIQFDGFTTLLEVRFNVVPMGFYHFKMAICDVSDNLFDSGVFLESNSLSTNFAVLFVEDQPSIEHPEGFDVCRNDSVHFNLSYNFNPSNIVWDFGDGATGNGIPAAHIYTSTGDYEVSCDIYENIQGQDSLVMTQSALLHVHEGSQSEIWHSTCDFYTCFGQTFTESGDYVINGQTIYGCDSIITLHLTINYSVQTILNDTACDSYDWHGNTYTQSGVYEHLEHTSSRCDSLVILNLVIYYNDTIEELVETCDSYTWHDTTYTQSGTYDYTITTSQGCTYQEILYLTLGQSYDIILNDTVCDFYPWSSAPDGFLTQSGSYSFAGQSVGGCDSIVSLNLVVHQTPHLEILGLTEVAISTDLWHGIYNYCLADSTELQGCDIHWSCSNPDWVLMPMTNPVWCKLIAKSLGQATLTAVSDCGYGCDTLCSLDINASHFDVGDAESQAAVLFPNPAHGQVTIHAPQLRQVKIYNSIGMVSKNLCFESTDVASIDINDLAQGFYTVEITTAQGKTAKKLIILE